jgi:UTP-glucose-1-phosphate uridylyltransferase
MTTTRIKGAPARPSRSHRVHVAPAREAPAARTHIPAALLAHLQDQQDRMTSLADLLALLRTQSEPHGYGGAVAIARGIVEQTREALDIVEVRRVVGPMRSSAADELDTAERGTTSGTVTLTTAPPPAGTAAEVIEDLRRVEDRATELSELLEMARKSDASDAMLGVLQVACRLVEQVWDGLDVDRVSRLIGCES